MVCENFVTMIVLIINCRKVLSVFLYFSESSLVYFVKIVAILLLLALPMFCNLFLLFILYVCFYIIKEHLAKLNSSFLFVHKKRHFLTILSR